MSTGTVPEQDAIQMEPLKRLKRDLVIAAKTLSDAEARYLVDLYYQIQGLRIASENQTRSVDQGVSGRPLEEAVDVDPKVTEPHTVLDWFTLNTAMMEAQIKRALDVYSDQNPVGRWAKSQMGIGPVLASGLLSTLFPLMKPSVNYPNSFNTAGKIWRFAGLDPTQKWFSREQANEMVGALTEVHSDISLEALVPIVAMKINRSPETLRRQALMGPGKNTRKLEKITKTSLSAAVAIRPWNASLKVLCWKIGESFIKVQSNEKDYYGKLYAKRKAMEQMKNERGDFAETAKEILQRKRFGKDTDAFKHLSGGKLPPAQIHARARRYAVKMFLSHLHEVMWRVVHNSAPPVPYVIEHMGHRDYLAVPGWDPTMKDGGK